MMFLIKMLTSKTKSVKFAAFVVSINCRQFKLIAAYQMEHNQNTYIILDTEMYMQCSKDKCQLLHTTFIQLSHLKLQI